jgi:hypothetical protein
MGCKWVVRPGTNNSLWAYTTCNPGFNYLSKVDKAEQIKPVYDGCECPICKKPIECNTDGFNNAVGLRKMIY